jgi:hypothetical protein
MLIAWHQIIDAMGNTPKRKKRPKTKKKEQQSAETKSKVT